MTQAPNRALFTDLYELTMAASYFAAGMDDTATFELFIRELPRNRNFLVVAGLEDVLDYLESLRFEPDDLAYLQSLGTFRNDFLEWLETFHFTGDVWAMLEGEIAFAEEPLLRVTAPRIQAQLVETFLLNAVNYQTLVATKAARVAIACRGRRFVDFSPRRDHGFDAALKAARAAYIAGAAATSNVLAGKLYGIPVAGTMAHSYVMSFDSEVAAFRRFARDFPGTTLLIDTYDTIEGARHAAAVARELAAEGITVGAVRLDSGNLAQLAKDVRRVLDEEGFPEIRIFASGDLDEYRIAEILDAGAPVDAFGVGTQLGTSGDAPWLGGVYKLVEDSRGPRVKLAERKATAPGAKQVYRFAGAGGVFEFDMVALAGEQGPLEGRPLLRQVMEGGRRTLPPEPLSRIRERCLANLERIPERLKSLETVSPPYPVRHSAELERLLAETRARVAAANRPAAAHRSEAT
jgi:nicotinate phosphoribosyltransferase